MQFKPSIWLTCLCVLLVPLTLDICYPSLVEGGGFDLFWCPICQKDQPQSHFPHDGGGGGGGGSGSGGGGGGSGGGLSPAELARQQQINDSILASNEGLKYEEIGDWDNAIRLHKKALRINPNNEIARLNLAGAINNKGVEYDNRKEYENALRLYEESLRINPNNAVTRKNILLVKSRIVNKKGIEYYEKRDYDSAISRFEEAIKVNPEHQTARDNLKEAKERKKEQGEAETRRLREQRFEAQLEEERLAKQKREEKERLEEQKLKEAKHRVNNMLDSLAKKFDISPPVGASKSSSSSGLSLMGPSTRLFEKGTKGSAPVDLRLIPPDKPVVVHPEDVKGTGPGNYTKEVAKQLNEGDIAGARADAARITGSFEKAWAYQRIARAQA
ncbi:MAG: tetratricopeptide repeat protein, partial [Candidatus Brocadiales bacterium]|nr:tetratricopeptide repeat protein [Candidatus Bathyanammoxibius sp.]